VSRAVAVATETELELTLRLDDSCSRTALFGSADRNLRLIRQALEVRITARDSAIRLSGQSGAVTRAASVIEKMQERLKSSKQLNEQHVIDAIAEVARAGQQRSGDVLEVYSRQGVVAKTPGQEAYVRAFAKDDLVFCLGPAGTGKTYLAVAMGVALLKRDQIKRIVLVRPAVEAGEKLGYLPGDMQAKVNPYLRPLFDAMHDMMSFEQTRRFIQNDIIEVIPLAFMRGRTLNNAAVILDEAQNTTVGQMLMFLTRLGHHSKMVVTGDDSQVDLAAGQRSGLIDAVSRLGGMENISIIRLTEVDIVRHHLVQDIVNAYGGDRDQS